MEEVMSSVPITHKDLLDRLSDAHALVESVSWTIQKKRQGSGTFMGSTGVQDKVQIIDTINGLSPDDKLLTEKQLLVVRAIRTGLQLGYHVSEDYRKRSGVASFENAATVPRNQLQEYNEKMQTASCIAQFVFARYLIWQTKGLVKDSAFNNNLSVELGDVNISAITIGFKGALYHLGQNIKRFADSSDEKLAVIVYVFADELQKDILNRTGSLRHVNFFSDVAYQLEDSEFAISGFALIDMDGGRSMEFNRLSFDKIVGNRDAKHFLYRDARRRACYDIEAQKNPFLELGGITPVFMGYGVPGTGKSMTISAYATLLSDLCEHIGVPFMFHPLPDNIIDSFQGNSARNMINWMQPMQDPSRIVWAPVDDAESILEDRLSQGISEGVKAVIGVFLRYTEGAYAIARGNSAIGVFTNLPEKIDPAVRSRIQARFDINGARTVNDFMDQDQLWWSKIAETDPDFINMTAKSDYVWHADQGALQSMGEVSEDLMLPNVYAVRELYEKAAKLYSVSSHEFIAQYYKFVQERYPLFSSRDARNIQTAVNLRIMDFDVPEDWFTGAHDVFFGRAYDEKLQMILELRRENMKGLTFSEIRMQEVNRYLDNMAKIADADFQRRVTAGVERVREQLAIDKEVRGKLE